MYWISFSRHTGVTTCRAKEKSAALRSKCTSISISTFFFNSLCSYFRMALKTQCNVFSKHCFKSLCISNIFFNMKDKFLICSALGNIVKWGKYAKIRLKMLKNTVPGKPPVYISARSKFWGVVRVGGQGWG